MDSRINARKSKGQWPLMLFLICGIAQSQDADAPIVEEHRPSAQSGDEFDSLRISPQYKPMAVACKAVFFSASHLFSGKASGNSRVILMNVGSRSDSILVRAVSEQYSMDFNFNTGAITAITQKFDPALPSKKWTFEQQVELIKRLHLADNLGYTMNGINFNTGEPDSRLGQGNIIFYRNHLGHRFIEEKMYVVLKDIEHPVPISFLSFNVTFRDLPSAIPPRKVNESSILADYRDKIRLSPGVRKRLESGGMNEPELAKVDMESILPHLAWVHKNSFFLDAGGTDLSTDLALAYIYRMVLRSGNFALIVSGYIDCATGLLIGGDSQMTTSDDLNVHREWIFK